MTFCRDFYNPENVSFIGRPVPLDEADEHFGRLSSCGFTCLRLLTTWEAIEHKGPGIYDYEYLNYLKSLIQIADKYNINVFVDFHQDVWSRWTGGDGAPAWTLELVGFNISSLHESHAAFLHQEHKGKLPQMAWPTNYGRLGAGTMFTIFFAGNEYTPNLNIENENIQNYLQRHFLKTLEILVTHLKNEKNVIGYDIMNEPNEGFVGFNDLSKFSWPMRSSYIFSIFDAIQLGSGYSLPVDYYSNTFVYNHTEIANPNHISAWLDGKECIWKSHGVWDFDENTKKPRLLKPDYFSKYKNKSVDFINDFAKPFYISAAKVVHKIDPE